MVDFFQPRSYREEQPLPGLGRSHAAGRAFEQAETQILFHLDDGLGQGGLRYGQAPGGAGKAPLLRNGYEAAYVSDLDIHKRK